jgi:hypothetical protein
MPLPIRSQTWNDTRMSKVGSKQHTTIPHRHFFSAPHSHLSHGFCLPGIREVDSWPLQLLFLLTSSSYGKGNLH